jgi:hypothetical protein
MRTLTAQELLILLLLALFLLSGCTSMGRHSESTLEAIDFGESQKVRFCVYLDEGVTEHRAMQLLADAWSEEGMKYGIHIEPVSFREWKRPAFFMGDILGELTKNKLESPCDRKLAFLGRGFTDFAASFVTFEILGAVNDQSLTHGYVFAEIASLNQWLVPPVQATRHEIYHLLGCGEHNDMEACYAKIALMKQLRRSNEDDFYPAWDLENNSLLPTRLSVNQRLGLVQ